MRTRTYVLAAMLSLPAVVAPAVAGDRTSGPKVGEGVSAFDVHDVTGPSKGKTLCYV